VQLQLHLRILPGPQDLRKQKSGREDREAELLCGRTIQRKRQPDQRYLAEKDLFPCGDRDESRFSPDFQVPISVLGIQDLEILTFLDNGTAQEKPSVSLMAST
jgi:hypothetical protein